MAAPFDKEVAAAGGVEADPVGGGVFTGEGEGTGVLFLISSMSLLKLSLLSSRYWRFCFSTVSISTTLRGKIVGVWAASWRSTASVFSAKAIKEVTGLGCTESHSAL